MEQILDSFVDNSVSKTIFIRTFVDYHSVFHIVASVRKYSHNSICAGIVVTELEVFIQFCPYQRFLAVENAIHFVIKSVVPIQHTGTHCLFSHLALIHVTWGLVMIEERNMLWQY